MSTFSKYNVRVPIKNFKFLLLSENATFPSRGSNFSAGWDLSSSEDTIIPARGKGMVGTGLKVRIPPETYGRIAPRSGLTWKNGIDVGAGVIDFDYLGEIKVILFNHSDTEFVVKKKDRIAQFILEKINTKIPIEAKTDDPDFAEDATTRGTGGFGSTGI